ncbi:MAG TPA: hypothetical protein VM123_17375 [archaeon]|nr:hypothetical protein [archaeon]
MKCLGFTSHGEGLSVEMCEEVIQYHTSRKDGIPIAANLVVKSTNAAAQKYLGIWHRADVRPIKVANKNEWWDVNNLYTHLLFNINNNRGKFVDEKTINIKLFKEKNGNPLLPFEETENNYVTCELLGSDDVEVISPIEEELIENGLQIPTPDYIPYTCVKIGPFTKKNQYYLFRVLFKIEEPTFGKLVIENTLGGTRIYQVYGVDEIARKILCLDLPDLRRDFSLKKLEEIYNIYNKHFLTGLHDIKLSTKFYSIVAIDSNDSIHYYPNRMYTVLLRKGLMDLKELISKELFHHEQLINLKGKVFWFVNRAQNQDFRLQLEGPMAETSQLIPKEEFSTVK